MVAKTDPPQEKTTLAQQIVQIAIVAIFGLMLLALGIFLVLGGMGLPEAAEVSGNIGGGCLVALIILVLVSLHVWPVGARKDPIDPFKTTGVP